MGMLIAALLLVMIGAILGRGGKVWILPLVAIPIMVELVLLWQRNMEWLGKFLLTTDGILCESPLSSPVLLRWDAIEDAYYLPGKSRGEGVYCLSDTAFTLRDTGKLPDAPSSACYLKIADRPGLHEALSARLPAILVRKLDADRMSD